jgi:hypothetical protein
VPVVGDIVNQFVLALLGKTEADHACVGSLKATPMAAVGFSAANAT